MNKTKWQSRRWLICVWAITMTTVIILWQMVYQIDAGWTGSTLGLLIGIIGGYIASNTITKPKAVNNDSQCV